VAGRRCSAEEEYGSDHRREYVRVFLQRERTEDRESGAVKLDKVLNGEGEWVSGVWLLVREDDCFDCGGGIREIVGCYVNEEDARKARVAGNREEKIQWVGFWEKVPEGKKK